MGILNGTHWKCEKNLVRNIASRAQKDSNHQSGPVSGVLLWVNKCLICQSFLSTQCCLCIQWKLSIKKKSQGLKDLVLATIELSVQKLHWSQSTEGCWLNSFIPSKTGLAPSGQLSKGLGKQNWFLLSLWMAVFILCSRNPMSHFPAVQPDWTWILNETLEWNLSSKLSSSSRESHPSTLLKQFANLRKMLNSFSLIERGVLNIS